MKNIFLLIVIFISFNLQGQSFWRSVDESAIPVNRDIERGIIPISYATVHLDLTGLTKYLKDAPKQFNSKKESLPLYIPMPNGEYMLFDIVYSSVMKPKLAKKYPQIMSFKGFSRNNDKINIRFSIGPNGFYGAIHWRNNNIYIDPFAVGIKDYYISYFTRDYKVDISDVNLACGANDNEKTKEIHNFNPIENAGLSFRDDIECDPIQQFNYTLALACTGEWGQNRGTVSKALADMVTSVNRLNQIYENEFSIHFILHENNDTLIFLDPDTDPFKKAGSGHGLLDEVQSIINNRIGRDSYDIGHIFTNGCSDVGGVARLACVCDNSCKAKGVTCHAWDNLNYIVTNITAHEMGHQFSAKHTFNKCDQLSSDYGYEPGGGNTIMAYCGLCGSDNVDYQCLENFHAFSIEQIKSFSREYGGSTCADKISLSNTAPKVSLEYPDGFYIPISTPFVLKGNAYDCEGDDMTYTWEQMNLGPAATPGEPRGNSPLFNAREPINSPVRYFPELKSVLNNLNSDSEVLPTYSRDLDFRFTARDNHPGTGGTDWTDVSFYVSGNAGPFLVTYPNDPMEFEIGEAIDVTWDVANTDNSLVNCKRVNILLSMDKGYTYPYILKYNTPNDGTEKINLPDSITTNARIKVEASDNIFYDVSNYNIRIKESKDTSFIFDISKANREICLPLDMDIDISTRGINGYSDSIRFEITDLPEGTLYEVIPSIIKSGETAKVFFNFDNTQGSGFFEPTVLGISTKGDTVTRQITWAFNSNRFKNLEIANPIPGSSGQVQNTVLRWKKIEAINYVNVYLSPNPAFPNDNTISKAFVTDSFFDPNTILDYSTLYYWKLEFINNCGVIDNDTIYTFSTLASDCKDYISEDDPPQIKSAEPAIMTVDINEDLNVTDVNVTLKGRHSRFKEISASLISPTDTVLLFNNRGFSYQGSFNLTFNDEANYKIKQPPIGTFKPDEPLSLFHNKNGKGKWQLVITDNKFQLSGELSEFILNICSNKVLDNPYIVNNNLFKIPMDKVWPITINSLQVKDNNNTDAELTYTIVKDPNICDVYLNNDKLRVGSTFTQADINNHYVKIKYPGNNVINDKFYFTVIDGTGGWIGITPFEFESDETIKVDDIFEELISIYPNPTNGLINIDIDKPGKYTLEIYSIEGKKLLSKPIYGHLTSGINLSEFNAGIYIVKINNNKYNFVDKIVKRD